MSADSDCLTLIQSVRETDMLLDYCIWGLPFDGRDIIRLGVNGYIPSPFKVPHGLRLGHGLLIHREAPTAGLEPMQPELVG